MSAAGPDCRHVRLHIGAEPRSLPPEIAAHLETCAECRRFRDETLALDDRLRAALELPLTRFRGSAPPADFRQSAPPAEFRQSAPPARRFALAASVVLALLAAGGLWVFRPQPALAGEIVEHVTHEAGSWEMREQLPASAIADVLAQAGVKFDASLPVVYAMPCEFRGHVVPHLVVQTANGPMTVMLLANEKVAKRTEFSENGFHGALLPAGNGSVAVLMRDAVIPAAVVDEIVSEVRF
jgi:hypothetical protein